MPVSGVPTPRAPPAAIAESDEGKPGVVLDYDCDENLVSLEILDASRRVTDTSKVEFQLAE